MLSDLGPFGGNLLPPARLEHIQLPVVRKDGMDLGFAIEPGSLTLRRATGLSRSWGAVPGLVHTHPR